MSDWISLFKHTFVAHPDSPPPQTGVWFAVMNGVRSLRMQCIIEPVSSFIEIVLLDPDNIFRGRWDASFQDWKTLDQNGADDGFISGDIQPGQWRVEFRYDESSPEPFRSTVIVEGTTETVHKIPELNIYEPEDHVPDEDEPSSWMIGELFETTTRSCGALSVNETLAAYQKDECGFLAIADDNQPPIEKYSIDPAMSVIRAQSLKTPDGEALLLGVEQRIEWKDVKREKTLFGLVRETHMANGLFCLTEPFSDETPSWLNDDEASPLIDLIQVWSGESSDEKIQQAFNHWDKRLNQGHRLSGVAAKGPDRLGDNQDSTKFAKTVVFTQGPSETALLSALKQGRFYSTVEPALSFWTESAHGGAMMGDELRLPVETPFLLYLTISQLDKGGYFTIRTNDGIYCQTPYSTRNDTSFKLIISAKPGRQWFRLEVYQFARPLDRLIAFTNPIFVRGYISL